jgi:Sap, sulfolipid-1-addressing protein
MNLTKQALSPEDNIAALGLVLLVFAIPVLALIGLSATVPLRASTILESWRRWMVKNNRAITVVLCLVFGAFFLVGGLWGA